MPIENKNIDTSSEYDKKLKEFISKKAEDKKRERERDREDFISAFKSASKGKIVVLEKVNYEELKNYY